MHVLLKPVYHLLEPLTLVVLGMTVLTVMLFRRKQRGLAFFSGGLWLVMVLTTCTAIGDWLLSGIEREWADMPSRWESLPTCDAVVCLGGGVLPNATEINGLDMQDNSDRITTAIELIRRGKAPFLMLGGGSAVTADGGKISESKAIRHWIESWKLISTPVDDLGICTNTREEAQRFAEKAKQHGWKKIILVTSASHMRRAAGVFRKATGLEIAPVACAFKTGAAFHDHPTVWFHFPEGEAVGCLSVWFYETLGWWTYKARGWV
ncbi:MAG: putative conserved rane protein [Verrucomicrobiaceae bacterium]|nr:putative conserved rane protein [Verrucomicrobiaceae bacterium]MDB6119992.1 putative conserved rane protein [Verrucomicrobiaceae bacterium]